MLGGGLLINAGAALNLKKFKFKIDTSKGSGGTANRFYLPINNATYVNAIYVNWGDGTSEEKISSGTYPYHTYSTAGTYTVTVRQTTEKMPFLRWSDVDGDTYNKSNKMLTKILTPLPVCYDGASVQTNFSNCFFCCTGLTSLPTDLFRYNTSVTDFTSCFVGCASLTSLPTDLFRYNTSAFSFGNCFASCTSLTSIPTDLFRYNTNVTNFVSCFQGCTKIATTINPTLNNFFASSLPTSGINVKRMFYNCSASGGNATNFVSLFNSRCEEDTQKTGALYNCTSWTGYSGIAAIWKKA